MKKAAKSRSRQWPPRATDPSIYFPQKAIRLVTARQAWRERRDLHREHKPVWYGAS